MRVGSALRKTHVALERTTCWENSCETMKRENPNGSCHQTMIRAGIVRTTKLFWTKIPRTSRQVNCGHTKGKKITGTQCLAFRKTLQSGGWTASTLERLKVHHSRNGITTWQESFQSAACNAACKSRVLKF